MMGFGFLDLIWIWSQRFGFCCWGGVSVFDFYVCWRQNMRNQVWLIVGNVLCVIRRSWVERGSSIAIRFRGRMESFRFLKIFFFNSFIGFGKVTCFYRRNLNNVEKSIRENKIQFEFYFRFYRSCYVGDFFLGCLFLIQIFVVMYGCFYLKRVIQQRFFFLIKCGEIIIEVGKYD